jgi:LL-diaminopimelate aminotransferase
LITETNFIQNLFSNRIGGNRFGLEKKGYKFEKIKQAKLEALSLNPKIELIDMGLGEPDWMAEKEVVETLYKAALDKDNRGYADNGNQEFKIAAADYLKENFDIYGELNPEKEIVHCIGAKSALSLIPLAFINPGDILLMPVPSYPVIETHTRWLGGDVVPLPLLPENNFFPNLDKLDEHIKEKAKILYLNYPNNPTGAVATKEFYEKVVEFCHENNIIVVSDEAYGPLVFDTNPISFLSVQGAKEVGIVIHSLSKAFNMTGWRLGFIAGNEKLINAISYIKDNSDSGQFLAIQKAGEYCLKHPEITHKTVKKYQRRLILLASALREVGFRVNTPKGTFYLYTEAPKGIVGGVTFRTAEDFSQYLIREKLISTVPWDEAGKFIRFSVTFEAENESEEVRIINEIRSRLTNVEFIW